MKDLQKKNEKDLQKMLAEKREELRTFRFGTAGSKTRDVKAAGKSKREVAQILTELNSRSKSTNA